ncbi:notchless protein 1-like protein [Leptotrombidium deliense]|uniref:Notchless protein 1-like protein n=1 Tax=Leptotrombidium deliense TaxID=299467 RepID=A0A443SSR7_9ACAR|nr:notchless protein 1-like protein [Leptotrombidium deliense]
MFETQRIVAQFASESGENVGSPFELPLTVSVDKLQLLCNSVNNDSEPIPYLFFVNDCEVKTTLSEALQRNEKSVHCEKLLVITFVPTAVFSVKSVTRCTSTLSGHAEAIVSASFCADGKWLATGSGDTTVRFWDINTESPQYTCKGHRNWVLCISWAPNSKILASACKNGEIILWNPSDGTQTGKTLTGHKNFVTSLSWEPLHRNVECRRIASSSKDSTVKIWDVVLYRCLFSLNGHSQSVTCVKWGGMGLIYTSSQDRTVKVWRDSDGVLCRSLDGHAHWVNTLALSTDYVLRTAAFDPSQWRNSVNVNVNPQVAKEIAEKRYLQARGDQERLVSGSDDFTLFLWFPEKEKKCVTRMTGHQQLVNDVKFSPDARLIASASFDKSIKLWDGKSGKFITSLRGHVNRVYQISWSADSRLLVSGSADSTLKVWDISSKKLYMDLPGHCDQVYAVDWSPDGERVVSGGKDKTMKIWKR